MTFYDYFKTTADTAAKFVDSPKPAAQPPAATAPKPQMNLSPLLMIGGALVLVVVFLLMARR